LTIVAVTGHVDSRTTNKSLAIGMEEAIEKPLTVL